MKFFLIVLLFVANAGKAQQGYAYTKISTEDGIGLASNVVSSIYQDEKGFIWVGTANGLQRFDGSKFIQFKSHKYGTDELPHTNISQIIAGDNGTLILSMLGRREFGIFDPSTFEYRKITLQTAHIIPARAEFRLWKVSNGEIYLNVFRYGILHYDKKQNAFIDDHSFTIPPSWTVSTHGIFEDELKQQYWFGCDSGLCIYDKATKQIWNKNFNPRNLAVLKDSRVQSRITQLFIDRQRRIWIFGWPAWGNGRQYKFCFDSTGNYLVKDTAGLNDGPSGYTEYNEFYETKAGNLWIYGMGVLFNYDQTMQRFYFNKSETNNSFSINYETVNQVMEDKDLSIWIASDKGLYFASHTSGSLSVTNLLFNSAKEPTYLTDMLEMPNGDFWFASWGNGIKTVDSFLRKIPNNIYHQPPPANWTVSMKGAVNLTWSMCRQTTTGNVLIGCNDGILLVHDPAKKTTQYLQPAECNRATIRNITEDRYGQIWLGTQGGRLIKWTDNKFTVVLDVGTIIYKVFFDKQGWMWLATHEKGLYAVNAATGKIIQHYIADGSLNTLYGNTGQDIEQLNDSITVYGAGALNFVNKKTGAVKIFGYENGLPSNSVARLRMDKAGFLWIITSNGLCRYNPANNRITTYDRKDGIVLAEQTNMADYECSKGHLMFGGTNGVIMFNPAVFVTNTRPPDVTITDFKIFNRFLPLDSLQLHAEIDLQPDQNSFSIYFSSLSYMQRDKLTYYYKMEGRDKEWIKADKWYYENYSLLPPGKYTFKVYCENVEGTRSANITQLRFYIKPPFWRTYWFLSTLLFGVALIIYAVHRGRVKSILDVEKLRNRVARDLHDDMGSTLSTINILSAMAKTKMNTDAVKTTEYLGKISDNSQRMMEAMDDIVWSIKPSNDSMQKITARMREFATNVLEAKDIDLDFVVEAEVNEIKLGMEARKDFFLVFKESVNNAAKYSKADKVLVKISMHNHKLCLVVKDDGIGFDVANADGGNGMGNIQKRVDAMNGKVVIHSDESGGTKVMITIPVA